MQGSSSVEDTAFGVPDELGTKLAKWDPELSCHRVDVGASEVVCCVGGGPVAERTGNGGVEKTSRGGREGG